MIVEEARAEGRSDCDVHSRSVRRGASALRQRADGVVRRACTPVLLIPALGEHPWPPVRAARILTPLDGSSFAEEILGPTTDLASTLGAAVLLLRVVEPPSYVYAVGYPPDFLEYDLEAEVEEAHTAIQAPRRIQPSVSAGCPQ